MKIYAELHGDMQKPRTKSRGVNKTDSYNMNFTNNLASVIEETVKPKLHIVNSVENCVNAVSAIAFNEEGDRPYRVNSVNISPRRH